MTSEPVSNPAPAQLASRLADAVGASVTLVGHLIGRAERLVSDLVDDSVAVARESEALYARAAENAAAAGIAFRATPRLARIVREVLQLAGAYRLHGARMQALQLDPEARRSRDSAMHRRSAERLYQLCIELGGGVLKIGQFASTRMDLLPAPYIEALSRLQDRVPPVPFEQIAERIEAELGAPPAELFAELDEAPLATASLAQVHRATLEDGETMVAVKVQLPGIEDTVEIDMAALRILAGTLGDVLPLGDLANIVDELERSVLEELNFNRELENARALAENFSTDEQVVVPEVLEELSSRRVLTMSLVDGERLITFLDRCEDGGEPGAAELDRLFQILIGSYCSQILEHGLFQADPHPGNFLVLDGPRLALLDFGAVYEYPEPLRRAYADLAGAIIRRDHRQIADDLSALGFRTLDGSSAALVQMAEMLLDTFRPDPTVRLDSIDPAAMFEEALALARANPVVVVPRHFILLGRVFSSLGGLLMRYRPRINLFALIAPHLAPFMTPSD